MALPQKTTPSVQEIFAAINVIPSYEPTNDFFIEGRYPYTYAYDFVRSNLMRLMTPDEVALVPDYNGSRGMTARLVDWWANARGWDRKALILNLADAYLIEEDTDLPETSPNRELVAKGAPVKVSDVRREAGIASLAEELTALGVEVEEEKLNSIFDAMLAKMNS